MHYQPADRAPLWTDGLREDVFDRWNLPNIRSEADLARHFTFDRREGVGINISPRPSKVTGRWTVGKWLSLHRADDPARHPEGLDQKMKAWGKRDYVLSQTVFRGIFLGMGVGDSPTLWRVLYMMHDHPKLLAGALIGIADFVIELITPILQQAKLDYVSFDEPIADPTRPVIGPAAFERFVAPCYRRIIEHCRRYGVELFLVMSWGNFGPLIPIAVDAGINILWLNALTRTNIDYRQLRERYGRTLRLVGGIDSGLLAGSPQGIRAGVREMAPLVRDGGYIPLIDDRVRNWASFEAYATYRRALEEVVRS